jgi:hypothetical protein
MWTQMVGKIRLALSPPVNHWWHVTLYVTSRGLTTSPIPYGSRTFTIEFDFLAHHLRITTSEGGIHTMALAPRSVADFYHELMTLLRTLGIAVVIRAIPGEVEHPIPFADDHMHAVSDAAYAQRFWRILVQADRVLKVFRSRFLGRLLLDSRVVIGHFLRNILFLQAFHEGRDRWSIFGKSSLISSPYVLSMMCKTLESNKSLS